MIRLMQYRLRTLLILLAIMPPLLAISWSAGKKVIATHRQHNASWHLRQIGLGMHNYHGDSLLLPPGARLRYPPPQADE
jgi:hypothetical protein